MDTTIIPDRIIQLYWYIEDSDYHNIPVEIFEEYTRLLSTFCNSLQWKAHSKGTYITGYELKHINGYVISKVKYHSYKGMQSYVLSHNKNCNLA